MRYGSAWPNPAHEYNQTRLDIEDEIRDLMFGSSDLVELGIQWGMIKPNSKGQKHGKDRDEKKNEVEEKDHHERQTSADRRYCKGHRKSLL